jgi:thioester reductase-like protein
MSGSILLTGATGFLGMDTLAQLLEHGEDQIVLVVRARDRGEAEERLAALLARLYDEPLQGADRVSVVRGDLLEPGLGLSPADRRRLVGSVERIVHCAASISFDLPLAQARRINVGGVERVLELAREIASGGSLRRLVHVSTAYVSGYHAGRFGERDLEVNQGFRNTYERSKFEAEQLLHAAADLPVVIARPSIVVGHRASGWTPAFNVIYWPIRAAERGMLRQVPGRSDSIVDFVPVDYVTDGILALLEDREAHGTYHLVAGAQALSAGQLAGLHASLLGGPPIRFVPREQAGPLPQGAESYLPYFDVRCSFDDARARHLFARAGVVKPDPREYLGRLISFARETRWGKRPLSRQAAMDLAGVS